MKRLTIILNALIMAVFGFASTIAMSPLHNRVVEYPTPPFINQPLPSLSAFLLSRIWLAWAVPLVWAICSFALALWRKPTVDAVLVHTSATIFVSTTMFFLFAIAGIFPFIGIIAHLK
ncbi:MAG: hypothetical protein H7A43_11855 [Verrucomicrobia bacterium]|nr:hypothetical protein [Verrucomicrobiota bacterium]